jgi:hypothetical protein
MVAVHLHHLFTGVTMKIIFGTIIFDEDVATIQRVNAVLTLPDDVDPEDAYELAMTICEETDWDYVCPNEWLGDIHGSQEVDADKKSP